MLRIERSLDADSVVLALCGRLDEPEIELLRRLLEEQLGHARIVLDLAELKLVARPGIAFLERCEASGIELSACPDYVRQWIQSMRGAR